jgi:hypothetical protein
MASIKTLNGVALASVKTRNGAAIATVKAINGLVIPRVVVAGYNLYLDAGNPASNSGSGATWSDLSGNGLDYTWAGGYGRGGSGLAAYFTTDGVSGTSARRSGVNFYGTAQTWSGWFYATQDATQRLVEQNLAGINQITLVWTAGGKISFQGYDTASYVFQTPTTGGASGLSQGTWYHVAGVYDGANADLYINGVLVATVAQTGGITSAASTFTIGELSSGGQAWMGRVAQVVLYPTNLSGDDILANFNADKARYGY